MTQALNLALLGNSVNASGDLSLTTGVDGTLPVANGGTGRNTLTANNVLLGNGTTAVQQIAPGASGNILQSNGTTWASVAAGGYIGGRGEVFTSTGTFTVPAGITAVKVTVIGGGGGGGNAIINLNGQGSGGGGGGIAIEWITGLTPAGTVTVTVGAGGASAAAGTTSSFGAFCSATGGAGGIAGGTSENPGGAGGSGSGGTFNLVGGSGGGGQGAVSSLGIYAARSGPGGGYSNAGNSNAKYIPTSCSTTEFLGSTGVAGVGYLGGFGGAARISNGNGNAATGFGCGGGGGNCENVSTDFSGGAGTAGIVIVEY